MWKAFWCGFLVIVKAVFSALGIVLVLLPVDCGFL